MTLMKASDTTSVRIHKFGSQRARMMVCLCASTIGLFKLSLADMSSERRSRVTGKTVLTAGGDALRVD